MEAFRSWGICVTVCILAAAVIRLLFPNVEKEKSVRVLISTFLLCAVLSPFISGDGPAMELPELDVDSAAEQLDQINAQINRSLESQAQSRLIDLTAQVLAEAGVTDAEIEVKTDILDDGHIQIDEIVIISSASVNWGAISDQVTEATGCPVRINTEVNE